MDPNIIAEALQTMVENQGARQQLEIEAMNRNVEGNRETNVQMLRVQQDFFAQQTAENRETLLQQIRNQQQALDALIARVNAPQPPIQVAGVPVVATLPYDLIFDGTKGDAVVLWLARINQKRQAENWTRPNTLRAAIGALRAKALEWHEGVGAAHENWNDWSTAILTHFEIKLSEFQWMLLVEGRTQKPNESGADYALAKRALIKKTNASG
jgi:hypothetical protein